jgi:hypothetical protein
MMKGGILQCCQDESATVAAVLVYMSATANIIEDRREAIEKPVRRTLAAVQYKRNMISI